MRHAPDVATPDRAIRESLSQAPQVGDAAALPSEPPGSPSGRTPRVKPPQDSPLSGADAPFPPCLKAPNSSVPLNPGEGGSRFTWKNEVFSDQVQLMPTRLAQPYCCLHPLSPHLVPLPPLSQKMMDPFLDPAVLMARRGFLALAGFLLSRNEREHVCPLQQPPLPLLPQPPSPSLQPGLGSPAWWAGSWPVVLGTIRGSHSIAPLKFPSLKPGGITIWAPGPSASLSQRTSGMGQSASRKPRAWAAWRTSRGSPSYISQATGP